MIIANPIYDSVFKYLLEDVDIARELLSTILGEEIVKIDVKPQETTVEMESYALAIFRLDFKCLIKTKTGEYKKVLIELQKAKKLFDIMRFRTYLAENYRKTDKIPAKKRRKKAGEQAEEPAEQNVPLAIITIYFLGFELKKGYPPVFKTSPQISNVITGEVLTSLPKEPFVDLLTHQSYTIQIPTLTNTLQTRIEKVLMIFSPDYVTSDRHKSDYVGNIDDDLVNKILHRLLRAASDEQMRKNMDAEDEIENIIANLLRKKDIENAKKIAEKDKKIAEKEEKIAEDAKKMTEDAKKMTEDAKKIAEMAAFIATLKQQLLDKE